MSRPDWSVYFMDIAGRVAQRSTCPRRVVGAVVVKERRILSTGYNGAPSGLPHCTDEGCLIIEGHCVRTLHAEQNALLQAAHFGVSTEGSEIFTTSSPCLNCAKMLINAGIKKVWYWEGYPDDLAREFMESAGLELVHLELDHPLNVHLVTEAEGEE